MANEFKVKNGLKFPDNSVHTTVPNLTTTSTTATQLYAFDINTFGTAKILIQATSGGQRHSSELLVNHNGTVAYATEYAIVKTSGNLFSVDVDISSTNLRIMVTSASATSTSYKSSIVMLVV